MFQEKIISRKNNPQTEKNFLNTNLLVARMQLIILKNVEEKKIYIIEIIVRKEKKQKKYFFVSHEIYIIVMCTKDHLSRGKKV